jgi:hypothetical protein
MELFHLSKKGTTKAPCTEARHVHPCPHVQEAGLGAARPARKELHVQLDRLREGRATPRIAARVSP